MNDDELTMSEHFALSAALSLHPDGYGISIRELIAEETGTRPSFGKVYATLERLKDRGYLNTRLGEATAERGGRRKLHFEVTGRGQEALRASWRKLEAMNKRLVAEGAFA